MTWQDVAVFVVVAGAVLFLIGRNVNLAPPARTAGGNIRSADGAEEVGSVGQA